MIEMMNVMMFVVTMGFAGAQRHFVHLNHGHFHVQIVVNGSG